MNNPVSHELLNALKMDGILSFIVNAVPYGESLGEIGEMLQRRFNDAGAAVADKFPQMLALVGVLAAPIAIILILCIGKIAYDVFTGTADSIGDALLIGRYKIKTYIKLVFTKIRSLISPEA